MKITIAQLNPTVGDINGNVQQLMRALEDSHRGNSDLLVLPELFVTGYPPQDLLSKPWFIDRAMKSIQKIRTISCNYPETGILLGIPSPNSLAGKGLFNSAVLVHNGELTSCHKSLLPTYDVFDEARYFDPAEDISPVPFKGELLGITICEDAWNDPELWPQNRMYSLNPVKVLAQKGATLFINISASPFHLAKDQLRYQLISNHARRHGKPFIYVNQVGGNDELIFDGRSMAFNSQGEAVAVLPAFSEDIRTIDTQNLPPVLKYQPVDKAASLYNALVLGIRDYMRKCGFKKAVLGLSGGIDSALTACLACAAIGPENVLGITMPSAHSSTGSVEDSKLLADNLGMTLKVIPIKEVLNSYLQILTPHFEGAAADTTEENLQARIRGNYLMAFSNKYGFLLLSTGNKSEMSLGYCTLYGDMSGGLSVLADLPKTMVYEVSRYINHDWEIIPRATLEKPPSAELRPGQVDQDDLPPYEILDTIIHRYIEESYSVDDIIGQGFDPDMVKWIIKTIDHNEYKRRQAAPVLKVTSKAFGPGRRMPMAAIINQ